MWRSCQSFSFLELLPFTSSTIAIQWLASQLASPAPTEALEESGLRPSPLPRSEQAPPSTLRQGLLRSLRLRLTFDLASQGWLPPGLHQPPCLGLRPCLATLGAIQLHSHSSGRSSHSRSLTLRVCMSLSSSFLRLVRHAIFWSVEYSFLVFSFHSCFACAATRVSSDLIRSSFDLPQHV